MPDFISVTTSSFVEFSPEPLDLLRKREIKFKVNTLGRKLADAEILQFCLGSSGIIAGTETYSRQTLINLPGLKAISRCGVGMDNVDLIAARELGIRVVNTPDAPTQAVAELTIGLIFGLLRKISLSDRQLRNGIWKKHMGSLIQGKNIGIIGFGRIGKKVAELLAAFGVIIAYYDINPQIKHSAYLKKELKDLLGWADIISLHCSAKPGSAIIGPEEIRLIKRGALLLNLSRGGILDEEALYDALLAEKLSGAALDTFSQEPYQGKMAKLDNVILTPHIGSYAKESRIAMELEAVKNLLSCLEEI